jgi:uncharacterized protein YkwD
MLAAMLMLAALSPPASAGSRSRMVKAINHARAGHVQRVHFSKRLTRKATRWAHRLARDGVVGHSSSSAGGEIIEWHLGAKPRIGNTVRSWLHSPSHRQVMLSGSFNRAGAGKAVGWFGGHRATIWVVQFGHG